VIAASAAVAGAALLGFAGSPAGDSTVVQVDRTWTCTSKVDLDLVKVTITRPDTGDRRREDAVHLQPGCTGRIGRLEVVQYRADGVKVVAGVHDLTVGGGSVRCLAKAPVLHQDGIQVMGGARITFRGLSIDCGRSTDRLINSNLFIKQAGKATEPPSDVVCDRCSFGGWAAHTVSVQDSVRSGVTNSSLCLARFPQLTLTVGKGAQDPVVQANSIRQCGPGRLTLDAGSRTAVYGDRLVLSGLFLAQQPGSRVTAEARAYGSSGFVAAGTTTSLRTGRFRLVLHPKIGETVRLRSGSIRGPATVVRVQPRVLLARAGARLVARVFAARSYKGRRVTLQRAAGTGWVAVRRAVLGARSRVVLRPRVHGPVRLLVAAAPGYAAGVSVAVDAP
jgi:hypothetical protein